MSVAVTRVVNASVLVDIDGDQVLTDPYFERHWFLRLSEPIGMKVSELPELAAIVGGHGVLDHWQMRSLTSYPYRAATPVFVATEPMKRKAEAAGFQQVEVVSWGTKRSVGAALAIEVAPAQRFARMTINSYLLSTPNVRVFVGTEARDLEVVVLDPGVRWSRAA